MKKLLLTLGVSVMLGITANAQLNYNANNATSATGSYTDLGTNGTVIATANNDDANSPVQNIGFTFNYNGAAFTQFILNTNGFIKLGSTNPSKPNLCNKNITRQDSTALSSLNAADVNIISAFNHDLIGGTGVEYRVFTSGTAPNQVCTIQFKNVMDKNHGTDGQYSLMNFQINLNQNGDIDIVYGSWTATANPAKTKMAMIGIKGSDTTNIVRVAKLTTGWVNNTNLFFFNQLSVQYIGAEFSNQYVVDAGRTLHFAATQANDAQVLGVYALGEAPKSAANPQTILASVINNGSNTLTNLVVSLAATGANTFTGSQTIASLAPGASQVVKFSGFSPSVDGTTILTASVPSDDNNSNNTATFTQIVNDKTFATTNATKANNAIHFNGTGSGIIYCKYKANGSVRLDSVNAYIANSSTINSQVFGVIADSTGKIIGQSDTFKITAADTGKFKAFYVHGASTSKTFYAGIALMGGASLGSVITNDTITNAFGYGPLKGDTAIQAINGYGNFMIQAVLSTTNGIAKNVVTNNTLSVYPNPTQGVINLNLGNNVSGAVIVNVYDITGKQVNRFTLASTDIATLNIANLESGVYMLEVINGTNHQLTKITKE